MSRKYFRDNHLALTYGFFPATPIGPLLRRLPGRKPEASSGVSYLGDDSVCLYNLGLPMQRSGQASPPARTCQVPPSHWTGEECVSPSDESIYSWTVPFSSERPVPRPLSLLPSAGPPPPLNKHLSLNDMGPMGRGTPERDVGTNLDHPIGIDDHNNRDTDEKTYLLAAVAHVTKVQCGVTCADRSLVGYPEIIRKTWSQAGRLIY